VCSNRHYRLVRQLHTVIEFESLQVSAVLCNGNDGLVGQLFTASHVQALKSQAIVRYYHHRLLRHLVKTGDVKSQQTPIARYKWKKADVRELCAICQR
jgi:hypothetical protein